MALRIFKPRRESRSQEHEILLVVVCTANITRSAFLQRALQKKIDFEGQSVAPIRVRSAGARAQKGNGADLGMTMLARQLDIDLSHHRSQPFSKSMAQKAELVLTLEEWHRDDLLCNFPQLDGRIWTILEFTHGNKLENISIPDPTGGSPEEYHTFLDTARREVDLIFETLIHRGLIRTKT